VSRDPARIGRMVEKLRALWLSNPDMRLGQLAENLGVSYKLNAASLYHIEDDDMERRLDAVNQLGWESARMAE
jgi:hypothetical protein